MTFRYPWFDVMAMKHVNSTMFLQSAIAAWQCVCQSVMLQLKALTSKDHFDMHVKLSNIWVKFDCQVPGADPAIGGPGGRLPLRAWLCLKCTKFDQLTLRRITKTVAIRCQIYS